MTAKTQAKLRPVRLSPSQSNHKRQAPEASLQTVLDLSMFCLSLVTCHAFERVDASSALRGRSDFYRRREATAELVNL